MITLGLEEEVFVTEPLLPTTRSLYYLAKLLWKKPSRNYHLTASNFARGKDLKYGMMSGLEVATDICHSPLEIITQLRELRAELSKIAMGYIVPLGHLIQIDAPTNVCALQIHIGGSEDIEHAYDNIAHFLPAIMLMTANAPFRMGERFGQSYRLAVGYATGPLTGDRFYRFQDLIISRRLGTIEVRALDPVTCTSRIKYVLDAVYALAQTKDHYPLDLERYKKLREQAITNGASPEIAQLARDLNKYCNFPVELIQHTQSDTTAKMYEKYGLEETYRHIDSLYRMDGILYKKPSPFVGKFLQPTAGFLGYYAPKFPYVTYKWLKEK